MAAPGTCALPRFASAANLLSGGIADPRRVSRHRFLSRYASRSPSWAVGSRVMEPYRGIGSHNLAMITTTVFSYQAGLLYKNGSYVRTLGAGRYLTLFGRRIEKIDLRQITLHVASQEIL